MSDRTNSRVPPPPSDNWLTKQIPEETKQIQDVSKSKTLPIFQKPIKQRRNRKG